VNHPCCQPYGRTISTRLHPGDPASLALGHNRIAWAWDKSPCHDTLTPRAKPACRIGGGTYLYTNSAPLKNSIMFQMTTVVNKESNAQIM